LVVLVLVATSDGATSDGATMDGATNVSCYKQWCYNFIFILSEGFHSQFKNL